MAGEKLIITKDKLDALANSISAKSGESLPMTLLQMKEAVDGIVISDFATSIVIPEQTITTTQQYTEITNFNELLIEGTEYRYTINNNVMIAEAATQYGSVVLMLNSNVLFECINNKIYFSVMDSSLYGNYTIKVEKIIDSSSATLISKSITSNGTYNASDDSADGYSSVTVNVSTTTPTLQSKTATPSETAQTITADSGYDGLSNVAVEAISSTYVGSGVRRISDNSGISINGNTVSVTGNAFYTGNISKTIPLQSKTASPSESEQTITADTGNSGLSSVTVEAISSTYIGSGIAQRTSTDLTASGATVTVPSGYYTNQATKSVASGTEGTPTASKGTVSNHAISITPSVTNSEGYISGGTRTGNSVTVTARELVQGTTLYMDDGAGNYDVANAETFVVDEGTAGTPTASKGTVSNHSISVTPTVTNVSGYIDGGTKTGTAVSVSASELVSGTYSVTSSGTKDVTNYASISVGSGTEGTPTATKGTVSNHSVSITPSVTNSGGYITGSTKTGTAVTVSASELVSGSQTITENGTVNVINLASVNVAIPVVTYYTGTSEPVASQYNDGDIYLKVVSN